MRKGIKWLIAKLILYPLVYRNYRLREQGKLPDKWYWADIKLSCWGFLYRKDKITRKVDRTQRPRRQAASLISFLIF